MKKSVLILMLLVLGAGLALAQAAKPADVKGSWDITVSTPRGDRTSTMTIVQDGEKLKVTMSSQRGDVTGDGTIKGNDITWSVTRTTPRGDTVSTYAGKLDGDNMSGDIKFGDQATGTWKASRKKA